MLLFFCCFIRSETKSIVCETRVENCVSRLLKGEKDK